MSYTSESTLRRSASLARVQEVVGLMGYKKVRDGLKVPGRIGGYFWYDQTEYRSWSGVELDIYKTPKGPVKVTTRSTISRSYWDLLHQNRTLKLLRDLFGGQFDTDAGRNRYWRPEEPPPSPISSGCFLARWRFHNHMGRAQIYLMSREFKGNAALEKPAGFGILDEYNPRLLSNNLLVPYMIAVWEEYFRATFAACLKYSAQREAAFKRAKLSHADLEEIAVGSMPVERAVAERFSFQRPSSIADAFKLLDQKLNMGSPLRKPYRNRTANLFESIERLVDGRNSLVHSGENLGLFDKQLKTLISDLTEAVNRCYDYTAKHYGFVPNHDY